MTDLQDVPSKHRRKFGVLYIAWVVAALLMALALWFLLSVSGPTAQ
jgi:hypothetical protein